MQEFVQNMKVLKGFYVLEGIDGAGTTTQAQRLARHLSKTGPTWFTFEPTESRIGKLIRDSLHGPLYDTRSMACLYAVDRSDHVFGKYGIEEQCSRNHQVVCDRYIFSSLAYQGYPSLFDYVCTLNAHFPLPEILFFLDTPLSVASERLYTRPRLDRFEQPEFQESVVTAYRAVLDLPWPSSMCVVRIDGDQSPDKVFDDIRRYF